MLGVLLERLEANKTSDYVFPSPRDSSNGAITSVKSLIEDIRSISGLQHVSPHDIRRTLAQITRDAYALTGYADEHILHSQSHYSGSTANYLDPNAIEFTARRADTYKRTYERLDDLILSNAILEKSINPQFVIYLERPKNRGSNDMSIVRRISISAATDKVMEEISSPVGSTCAGTQLIINAKKRPKTYQIIEQSDGLIFRTKATKTRTAFKAEL